MRPIPQSGGRRVQEFNGCHSPENGRFCSTEGGGSGGSAEDTEVTIQRIDFPNGPRFSVIGKQTGKRLFPPPGETGLKNEAGIRTWLKKNGWSGDTGPSKDALRQAKKTITDIAYGGNRRKRVTIDVLSSLSVSDLRTLRDAYSTLGLDPSLTSNKRMGLAATMRSIDSYLRDKERRA